MSHSLKTRQAIAKRFKLSKKGKGKKIIKRTNGQAHFNAKERGNTRRNKRSDHVMSESFREIVTESLAH